MCEGRVAGIDYGSVRIGIAISDPGRTIASPFQTHTRHSPEQDAVFFRRLAEEQSVSQFVVGLPVHLDGRESQKSAECRRFGKWLQEVTGVPVVFFDERFSTAEAERLLAAGSLSSAKRKKRIDRLAAQIILAAYLESDQAGQENPGALDG